MVQEFNIRQIKEIKNEIKEYRELKRILKRKRSKICSLTKKYDFITSIQSPEIDDLELEIKILDLFKTIGYKTHIPDNTRDLDGYITFNGDTIGIEAKNSNGIGENELLQAPKYSLRNTRKGIHTKSTILIWNNSKSNQEFDGYRIEDAENFGFGIITTKELVRGFLKVKNGNVTIDTFHKLLIKKGLIKFSSKKIKELG